MRAALIAMMILLLPAALLAEPTMGVYFTYTPGSMYYNPTMGEHFSGYLYAHNVECYLNAVEYRLVLPAGIALMSYTLYPGTLELGSPLAGHSLAIWPPIDGWNPGYNLLVTFDLFAYDMCYPMGAMLDAVIAIAPHPDTGLIQGSCWPENYLYPYTGLTSILCPEQYGVEETNWGAIKSLF